MQPIILALDTATDACSVAICTAKKTYARFIVEPQAHAKLLLGMVNDVCQEAGVEARDLDALAFGRGPGSFTGVRIAAGVIQGLSIGLRKPIIAVSSLQALAQQAANVHKKTSIVALIDARMHEVYWGIYQPADDGLVHSNNADALQKPEGLIFKQGGPYLSVGTGAAAYAKTLLQYNPDLQFDNTILYPRAEEVLQLALAKYGRGEILPPSEAIPTYVRNEVALKKKDLEKKNPD
ncbi:MAG TPA: tRNA (adenosine(37)-N6)-threonylcarbamoyltransferase complex dimerization subunit type 1 TsaB [Gammaproteobacteria bacterium]|nr:tRNA (adenosine(37)-N6)-threonylcarbamoyltransferase complex dimerization subunit type 1 TsaB [Gammaproteobacteria bacterium]